MQSLSLVMSEWAWSGSREQFLHCGLRKFRTSRRYTGDTHNSSVVGLYSAIAELLVLWWEHRIEPFT